MQSHRKSSCLVVLAILFLTRTLDLAAATPGSVDPSFDPGQGIGPITDSIPVRVIFPLADGSFLLGGYFTNYDGFPRPGLARIFEDGALDQSFVPDLSTSPRTEVWGIAQQPDGKFIIGGINIATGTISGKIVRLNFDGSRDSTFTFSRANSIFVMAVAVRPDGLISYLSDDNQGIGLLRSDGSPLLTAGTLSKPFGLFTRIRPSAEGHTFYSHNGGLFRFGSSFGLPDDAQFPVGNAAIYDFDFQSDGRIVCVQNGNSGRSVRRYFPNGVLDTNFVSKVGGTDLNALVCLPDDRILVGGTFSGVGTATIRNLARLNPDGSLDTRFFTGTGPNATVYAIAPVANGKALVAGKFTSYDGLSRTGLARIFLDPPAPPTFVSQPQSTNVLNGQSIRLSAALSAGLPISYQWKKDGVPIADATNSVLYIFRAGSEDAGKYTIEVTVSGQSAISNEAVVTVDPAPNGVGSLAQSFASGEASSRSIAGYLSLPDGKSLIGGNFFAYDGHYQPAIARLNIDGSLDTSLNLDLPPVVACTTLAREADGKILAGFLSARVGPTSLPVLMRLNPDGSANASFFPNASGDILTVAPLPDGRILIGGSFTFIGGTNRTRLARLNKDCTIDPTFDANALQLTKVYALAVQSDGKIIVGDEKRVLRLTADGAADADLPLTAGISQGVRALAIQSDGKIIVGGGFTAISGIGRTNLARLNADMSLDLNFTSAAGARSAGFSYVFSLAIQPDQKIFVGGTFFDLAGANVINIGRLLPTGAFDTTFSADVNLGTATSRVTINTMSLAGDGALTIGGLFSRVNNFTRNSIARIYPDAPPLILGATASFPISGPAIKLTYPGDRSPLMLQFTDEFPANWQDFGILPNGNSIELPMDRPQRFYRLKQ